jgi:hypothetical protein
LILLVELLPLGIFSGRAEGPRYYDEKQQWEPGLLAHIPLRVSGVLKSRKHSGSEALRPNRSVLILA